MKLVETIKEHILKLINYTAFGRLITGYYFLNKNHLKKSGWKKSVVIRMPIDKNGSELPWFTYSCIHFLSPRLNKTLSVFEYGSGNSTIWFSRLTKNVTSVEHNERWHMHMTEKLQKISNVNYFLKDLPSGRYQKEILNYNQAFNIIVLDGRERVECSFNVLQALTADGVIIWDNSDRTKYAKGYEFLMSNGFQRIDFFGMGPISAHSWSTSIFYKSKNCLNI